MKYKTSQFPSFRGIRVLFILNSNRGSLRRNLSRKDHQWKKVLKHTGLVFEFGEELVHRLYFLAALTLGRLRYIQDLQIRVQGHAQVLGREFRERLLFGFHDVGEGGIARLIETEIGRDHGWQGRLDCLQTPIDLPGDCDGLARGAGGDL